MNLKNRATMRASVVDRYGPPEVLRVASVPVPAVTPGHVLVRVAAAGVTAGDARIRGARFPRGLGALARLGLGMFGPRNPTLGNSFSGTVEDVGAGVTTFAVGDAVAGMTGFRMGTHAEYCLAHPRSIAEKPESLSFTDAAGLLFGGTTSLYFLRDRAKVVRGETVLVIGASGAVGSACVQLARHFGASVTAVTSARNQELVQRLGAERTIDYAVTPVTSIRERFDVVVDTVGSMRRADGLQLLRPGGRLALVAPDLVGMVTSRAPVVTGTASERAADIALLLDLAAAGHLDALTTVVGGLEQLPQAHRLIDSGRKVGNLVITPSP